MKRFASFFMAICLLVGLVPIYDKTYAAETGEVKVRVISPTIDSNNNLNGHWNFEGYTNSTTAERSGIRVTFNNNGFNTVLKIDGNQVEVDRSCIGDKIFQSGDISLKTTIQPISNDKYIQVKYEIRNNGTTSHIVSLAAHADVQIASNDRATVRYNSTTKAIELLDDYCDDCDGCSNGTGCENGGTYYTFRIMTANTYGVSDIDTWWFGCYDEREEHLWDKLTGALKGPTSMSKDDSGLTFGWLDKTIPAGSTLTLSNVGGIGDLTNTAPIITGEIVGQRDYYKAGDNITYKLTSITNDDVDNIVLKYSMDGDETMYSAGKTLSYPYRTGENITLTLPSAIEPGEHSVKIFAVDGANNVSNAITIPFTVRDIELPVIDSVTVTNNNTWTNSSKTIQVTVHDKPEETTARSGIKSIKLIPSSSLGLTTTTYNILQDGTHKGSITHSFAAPKNGTYTIEVEDNFGNKATQNVTIQKIDTTPPTITITGEIETEKWINQFGQPQINIRDSQSLIKSYNSLWGSTKQNVNTVQDNGKGYETTGLSMRFYPKFTNGKNNYCKFQSTDHAGNVGESEIIGPVWFDTELPSITASKQNSGGQYVPEETISLTASDQYSGINKFYYKITDSEECPEPDLTTGIGEVKQTYTREDLKITTPGTNYVHVWTEDLAGNRYNKHFGPFLIDRDGPTIKVDKTSSAWSDSITITATSEAASSSFSGIKSIGYKIIKTPDETPPTAPTTSIGFTKVNTNGKPSTFSTQINIPNEKGIYYVYLVSENNAGVESPIIERGPYKIDKDIPTIAPSLNKQEYYKNSIPLQVEFQDGTSNIFYTYKVTDSADVPEFPEYINVNKTEYTGNINIAERVSTTGIYYLHVKVKDVAEHTKTACLGPFYVDLDAPTVSIDKEKQETWSNEKNGLQLTVSMTDNVCTIDTYGYKITDNADEQEIIPNIAGSDSATIKITQNGKKYLHLAVKDTAGNITKKIYGPYWFDNTAPTTTIGIQETNEYADSITLRPALSDSISGLQSWEYAITNYSDEPTSYIPADGSWNDGAKESVEEVIYDSTNIIANETEGAKALYVKVTDIAGNTSVTKFGPYLVDTSKPIIDDELKNELNYIRYEVNLNMSDIGSGISKYGYAVDMKPNAETIDMNKTATVNNKVSIPVVIRKMDLSGTGNYYVHVQCQDSVGNKSNIMTFGPYVIDNTLPTASINAPEAWQNQDINIEMNTADNMLLQYGKYSINKNGQVYLDGYLDETDDTHHNLAMMLDEDGVYELVLEAKDGGENTKTATKTVKLDKTPPAIPDDWYDIYIDSKQLADKDGSIGDHVHIKDIAYIRVNAEDETSGISRFTYRVINKKNAEAKEGTILKENGDTSYYFVLHTSIDGEITPEDYIEVTFYDEAGNSSTEEIHDIVMDNVPPTINYGDRGIPDWINSTTKEALEELEGKENIDVDIYVADNMIVHGTAWKTLNKNDEDSNWPNTPTQENPDDDGIGANAIESGIIENSEIFIDPDAYDDGYYRIYVKAWDHTFNKNVNYLDFKVDKTAPVFNVTELDNTWHNTPITLDIKATDALSGVSIVEIYTANTVDREEEGIYEKYIVDNGKFEDSYVINKDGEYDVFITATDIAGNENTIMRHIKLDQQTEWNAPSVEFFNGEVMTSEYTIGEWSNTPVMAKYKYSEFDVPVSGLKNYTHGVNDTVYDITDDTEVFDVDGTYTFRTSSTSNAGLTSFVSPDNADINNEKEGYRIRVDKTRPIVDKVLINDDNMLENNMYFNHDIDLNIYAKDNLSGVKTYFYRLDDNDWTQLDDNVIYISSDTEYSGNIHFKVVDNANNESYKITIENFNIDTTKPVIQFKECQGNDIVLQASEPITKYVNGYFRFNDKETGKFVKTIYMNNNRIRVKDDLIYVNVSGMIVPGDYSLTVDGDLFSDKAGNMNDECTIEAKITSGETPELIGATATLPDGFVINAAVNRNGEGYHITLPTNTTEFTFKPIYSNPELAGVITSSYGEFDENGEIKLNATNIKDGVVDVKMDDKRDEVVIALLNYSINTDIDEGIKASTDIAKLEQAIDIYDVINNAISDISLTLSIKKANEEDEDIKKDIELAKTIQLNEKQTLSSPIDISIIQSINGEKTKLHHLQNDIKITIEIPQELRDKQWYKIVRIHDGDVDVLDAEQERNNLTFYSYRFSTYFILAGPQNYHSSSSSSSAINKYIDNWNFVVPYYGDDKTNIEPLSNTVSTSNSSYIRYVGKDKIKALYNPKYFSDMPDDHWAKPSVDFLAAREIFKGTSARQFEGGRNMTRAEAITLLVRLTPDVQMTDKRYFRDVEEKSWYTEYINTAYELGITKGISENRFGPEAYVTRQEFATMIYRYLNSPEVRRNQNLNYSDSGKIDSWALDAIIYMTTNNIMQGNDNNKVLPKSCITRYEAAELLAKTIKHIVAEKYDSTYRITNKNMIEDYK